MSRCGLSKKSLLKIITKRKKKYLEKNYNNDELVWARGNISKKLPCGRRRKTTTGIT